MAAPSRAFPSWKVKGNQHRANLGGSVATAGDVNGDGYDDVIVGADRYTHGHIWEGRAFVYHGSASGLSTTPDWTAESDDDDAGFGNSVGTAGDVNGDGYDDVIVGANKADGGAFVYHGSATGLSTGPPWTPQSDNGGGTTSVGTAGDVNGDGYDDVIVGAYKYGGWRGRAFVYHGSASGLSTTPAWTAESDQAWAQFGYSVGTAGDVNGDGYDDVIVGANREGGGRAFVYHGSATGLSTAAHWRAESDQASAEFGTSVGTAGDVNGDGYDDVIVGAPDYYTTPGRAFVYHGSASGLSALPEWTGETDRANAWFGISVGTAGDLDADGYADVVVGASGYDNGQVTPHEGWAFAYRGSATGLSTTPRWRAESDQASAEFGSSVGTAGDVNGDGYDDAIGGAPFYGHRKRDEGVAVVFHGHATALMAR